ncbi:hypothetical protein NOJ05_24655 [Neorhizobium galegae]|uniref:hypothetical protein n=1 Tax=Neorhizobium galegae TaxID=399 RepID=UPI002102B6A7|nr:hypothetical protein [Neorhizobium galegae]MCQ1780415.1 hypothetical protein [Neorhizobium galegae]MCQ1799131.1 hypothetical protein [Neorhizobium galegae]
MAAWQFALDLIPSAAAGVDGVVAARMTRGQLDEVELRFSPSVTGAIFERVGMMLPETKSWSPDLRIWGYEEVDDVQIWLRGTEIEHVQFRLNVADPSIPLVEEICSLAREVSCVLATRAGAILRPHPEVVLRAITRSEAARFVKDPEEYLTRLPVEVREREAHLSAAEYLRIRDLPLYGSAISGDDGRRLSSTFTGGRTLEAFAELLQSYRLCQTKFALSEDHDVSGLGAELQWMTPDQIVDEALRAYPGKVVTKMGYLPVAMCLIGSGDYYYINLSASDPDDPPLVRVPHEGVTSPDAYAEEQIEVVSETLSKFFRDAQLE